MYFDVIVGGVQMVCCKTTPVHFIIMCMLFEAKGTDELISGRFLLAPCRSYL